MPPRNWKLAERVSKSYAWQVAAILADFMRRARVEVTSWSSRSAGPSASRSTSDCAAPASDRLILKTFFWALFVVLVVLAGARRSAGRPGRSRWTRRCAARRVYGGVARRCSCWPSETCSPR